MMEVDRKLGDFVVDSNEAVEFKLIRESSDFDNDDIAFQPTLSHQIFGPAETIYGYKDLKIKLYFSAAQLHPFLNVSYSEKIDSNKSESAEADNIEQILTEKLLISFNQNIDEFCKLLTTESKFKPMGNLLHHFQVNTDGGDKTFVVYKADTATPGLLPYHERLQTFILWFIDAASFICVDDEKWNFFLLFEKYKKNGNDMYAIAGLSTVYEYYAYPEHLRPRISQMLVLPPFQRQGLGAELLRSIYNYYKTNDKIRDITVEDSSDELQSVRDYLDCQLCSESSLIREAGSITVELIEKVAREHKISKKQAKRVYEILRLKAINRSNANEYKQYRLEVKKRLNMPHQCEVNKLIKMDKQKKRPEVAELRAAISLKEKERLATLDRSYKELEEQYDRVLSRLKLDDMA